MNDSKPKIGFIGASGLMGYGMALNIISCKYELTIIANRNRENIEKLINLGANEVATYADLANNADIIILCVSDSIAVNDVLFAADKLIANIKAGTIIIDAGTSKPKETIAIFNNLQAQNIEFVDAPLSRSPAKAQEGSLVSFTSCAENIFTKIKPILDSYSEFVLHVGTDVGKAHKLKLINNFINTSYVHAWAEAYNTCLAANIEPEHLHAIVSNAGMNCLNFQNYSKFLLENNQDGHKFAIDNFRKDLRYYRELAEELGTSTAIVDEILKTLDYAIEKGYGQDFAPVLPKIVGEIYNTPAAKLPRGKSK